MRDVSDWISHGNYVNGDYAEKGIVGFDNFMKIELPKDLEMILRPRIESSSLSKGHMQICYNIFCTWILNVLVEWECYITILNYAFNSIKKIYICAIAKGKCKNALELDKKQI